MRLSMKQAGLMLIALGLYGSAMAQTSSPGSASPGNSSGATKTGTGTGTMGSGTNGTGPGSMGTSGRMKGSMPAGTSATSTSNFGVRPTERIVWNTGRTVGAKNIADIKQVQQALNERGHDVGAVDGVIGRKTQAAIRSFQSARGLTVSGSLDDETLASLGLGRKRSVASPANDTSSGTLHETSADEILNEPGASDTAEWE